MGTVHAKEVPKAPAPEEPEKFEVSAEKIKARVDRVHIDGVCRTKDDVLEKAVQDLFKVSDYQQVFVKANAVRKQLESLGSFKSIGIFIDTSKGENASPNGVEVTYHVIESRRVTGGVNTLVGNNEGSLVIGTKFPNLFGRGESLQTEYHYGTKKSSGFNATLSKPLLGWANPRITAAIFQQGADFVWSGFNEIDRGTLIEVLFESAPQVVHNLRWEGIWRDLRCLANQQTAFAVREQMGHSLKSSLKHILTVDKRDNPILPNYGTFFRLNQEYAGIGGDIGFHKHEIEYQVNQRLGNDFVFQGTIMAGIMRKAGTDKTYNISDRFFLGGPLNLRGFNIRGVGPHSEDNALGSESYWASSIHLYTPLPFRPGQGGIGDFFRLHGFLNAGNIGKFEFSDDYYQSLVMLMNNYRLTYGLGLILSVGHIARFELNYCFPIKFQAGDRVKSGLQFGVGVEFL